MRLSPLAEATDGAGVVWITGIYEVIFDWVHVERILTIVELVDEYGDVPVAMAIQGIIRRGWPALNCRFVEYPDCPPTGVVCVHAPSWFEIRPGDVLAEMTEEG